MKFRKDINGLRAFAVIAVVLFHFNASWMPGGFAGVDVFFVISGFLMTGIIFKGLENNNFSVLNFYVARANRIIPALAALCLALLVFGWFYLTPLEYKALGKHAASSVGFLSNVIYWREAGYFDAASHEKWLLHTWSLSVEWQFYIIYPLVLLALKRIFSLKILKSLIIVATVIGFIFSVYATYKWPSASYYLFPMRAWEMMLGGVAFLYPLKLQQNNKKLLEVLGLVLIVGSYIFITGDDPWPGYLALFPVLGTFLVIQAQRNESIITGNIIFQKLGAWSYSIYLWHWPFVVAIYTFSLPDQYIYFGMALSILLGYLSYKYIERIKFPRSFPTLLGYLKCKPVYIASILGVLGSIIFLKYESLSSYRLTQEQIEIAKNSFPNQELANCNGYNKKSCSFGSGPVKAIVVGDSHASYQLASIAKQASMANGSIIGFTYSGCPTIYGAHIKTGHHSKNQNKCAKHIASSLNIIKSKYPGIPVIVINRYSLYLNGTNEESTEVLPYFYFVDKEFSSRNNAYKENISEHMTNTICQIAETNPLYISYPIPEMKVDVPKTAFRSTFFNNKNDSIAISLKEYSQRHLSALKMLNNIQNKCEVKILNPLSYLCDSDNCYGTANHLPLYLDDDHLSSYGAELISPMYKEVFE